MKKTILIIATGTVAIETAHAVCRADFDSPSCVTYQVANPVSIYIPELGMYLNELIANGGPCCQQLRAKLEQINWNQDLRQQNVPVISRAEIQAFEREIHFVNMYAYKFEYVGPNGWLRQMMSDAFRNNYITVRSYLQVFSIHRPDAIR